MMAETKSVEAGQGPKAVAVTGIKRDAENRTLPRRDVRPPGKFVEQETDDAHLPPAAQLHIIPGLKSALDSETVKIEEQTATIDRIASVLKAYHMPPKEEGFHVARTKPPTQIEVQKTEWPLAATSLSAERGSAQLAKTAPHRSFNSTRSRLCARAILAAGALSLAALYIWFSDWRSLPLLPSFDQLSSYVIAHLPGPLADAEGMLQSDSKTPSSSKREKMVERIATQQSYSPFEVELAAISGLTATLSNTVGKGTPTNKDESVLAKAGEVPEVSGDQVAKAEESEVTSRKDIATVQPSTPPLPGRSFRYLDPNEVKVLMARGEQLMATGDVVAARGMFLRATEAEDPEAAIALGATYDPSVLRRLGVIGVVADLNNARAWYEKAEHWGSREARGRLEVLKR